MFALKLINEKDLSFSSLSIFFKKGLLWNSITEKESLVFDMNRNGFDQWKNHSEQILQDRWTFTTILNKIDLAYWVFAKCQEAKV